MNTVTYKYVPLYFIIFHFGEVRRAQLAKTTLLTSTFPVGAPGIFFRSIKICLDANESRVRKATGSYRTYSVPGKTTVLVSGFAVEDLPSSRTAD